MRNDFVYLRDEQNPFVPKQEGKRKKITRSEKACKGTRNKKARKFDTIRIIRADAAHVIWDIETSRCNSFIRKMSAQSFVLIKTKYHCAIRELSIWIRPLHPDPLSAKGC